MRSRIFTGSSTLAQLVRVHQQHRLDLGVVVRVVAGEQVDAAAAGHAQAGGRVGHLLADDAREHPREDADAEPARRRAAEAVAVGGEEARARDHVELGVRVEVLEHGPRGSAGRAGRRRRPARRRRSRARRRTCSPTARRRRCRGCTGAGAPRAPAERARSEVSSVEPSSTTTTSKSGACSRSSLTTREIDADSLKAGTMARWPDMARVKRRWKRASFGGSGYRGLGLCAARLRPRRVRPHDTRALRGVATGASWRPAATLAARRGGGRRGAPRGLAAYALFGIQAPRVSGVTRVEPERPVAELAARRRGLPARLRARRDRRGPDAQRRIARARRALRCSCARRTATRSPARARSPRATGGLRFTLDRTRRARHARAAVPALDRRARPCRCSATSPTPA